MAERLTLTTALGAAASLAAVASFLLSRKRQPAHLAPGVRYEATVSLSPQVPDETARRIIAAESGELLDLKQRRNSTVARFSFVAIAPRTVVPGETLFQFEGRKASILSIRELPANG